jgi:hypothetical protein
MEIDIKPIRIDIKLSKYYSILFIKILKEEIISYRELINKLLDFYSLESDKSLKDFRKRLTNKLKEKGKKDKLYLEELRLIHTYIGHYLEKIQYER